MNTGNWIAINRATGETRVLTRVQLERFFDTRAATDWTLA